MKNRYGMDGQTYNVTMDTNTGRIVIEDEIDIDVENAKNSAEFNEVKRKFFSLEQN
jgi:hypothetical protein